MIETAIAMSIIVIALGIALTSPLWILMLFGYLADREQRLKQQAKGENQ